MIGEPVGIVHVNCISAVYAHGGYWSNAGDRVIVYSGSKIVYVATEVVGIVGGVHVRIVQPTMICAAVYTVVTPLDVLTCSSSTNQSPMCSARTGVATSSG